MYAETVICKLYEARTDLGLTQQQVADGADMNVRTLINIEKGQILVERRLFALCHETG